MVSRFKFEKNDRWIKLSEKIKPLHAKVFVKVNENMYSGRVTRIDNKTADFKCDYNLYSGTYLLKDLRYRKNTERLYDVFLEQKREYTHYIEHVNYDYEKIYEDGFTWKITIKNKPETRKVTYYFYKEKGSPKIFNNSRNAIKYLKYEKNR